MTKWKSWKLGPIKIIYVFLAIAKTEITKKKGGTIMVKGTFPFNLYIKY